MLSLQDHHITDLYVIIDNLLPKEEKPLGGRPNLMENSELVTALVWNSLNIHSKTIRDIHKWLNLYHKNDFIHKTAIRIMDSTMLEVCKLQRADDHKTCKEIATFGKNWQGWHYGLKLHAAIDLKGRICGLCFTPANIHDSRAEPVLLNRNTVVAVGDGTYGGKAMNEYIFKQYGTIIIAPPHPKQNKKLVTKWQQFLLNIRSKIECTFDYLKNHMNLNTSFPRSVKGYFFHYLRIILGYQMMTV